MIVLMLFLSAAVLQSEALKCYKCVNCEEAENEDVVDCPEDKNCVAMNIYIDPSNSISIYRGCEEHNDCQVLEPLTGANCYICDKDLCNDAHLDLSSRQEEMILFKLAGIFGHDKHIEKRHVNLTDKDDLQESNDLSKEVEEGFGKDEENIGDRNKGEENIGDRSKDGNNLSAEDISDWEDDEILTHEELQEMFDAFESAFNEIDVNSLGFGF